MEKNNILKMAQAEKQDERVIQVKDKSMMWCYIVMVLVAVFFSFVRGQKGLPTMDLCATVSASCCAGQFYRFAKTKEKNYCVVALIMLAVTILSTIRFFMGH